MCYYDALRLIRFSAFLAFGISIHQEIIALNQLKSKIKVFDKNKNKEITVV